MEEKSSRAVDQRVEESSVHKIALKNNLKDAPYFLIYPAFMKVPIIFRCQGIAAEYGRS